MANENETGSATVERVIGHEVSGFVPAASVDEARARFRAGAGVAIWEIANEIKREGDRIYFVTDSVEEVEPVLKDRYGFAARNRARLIQAQNDPLAALTAEKWEEIVRDCQRTGKDVHRATAAFMFNAPYEEVTLEQRAIAKRYTFAFRFSVE